MNSSEFGMTCAQYVQIYVWRENLCALQVFVGALVSRPVCSCTRAQLRGNIAYEDNHSHRCKGAALKLCYSIIHTCEILKSFFITKILIVGTDLCSRSLHTLLLAQQ